MIVSRVDRFRQALSWRRLRRNPVVLKELRGRMRGSRAFIVLTAYLALLSAAISLVFLAYSVSQSAANNPGALQGMGKAVFGLVVGMELLTMCFVAPALTAGAISSERERQTYDLLRTTLLSARSLVAGKLFAAMSFLLLLLFAAFPLQSLAFLFGGVALAEVLIAALVLLVTALAFCALGLFFSSLTRRTLVSTVLAYAAAILVVFGLPVMFFTTLALFDSLFYGFGNVMTPARETMLVVVGMFLVSLNPIATAVITEAILIEGQSALYFNVPLSGGAQIGILSPWITYSLIYLLLSVLLIWLSIRFVRKPEK